MHVLEDVATNFTFLQYIFLGNVQSLINNKVYELCARTKFISDYRNASVPCFTETWLKPDTPSTHMEPDGFTIYRGDRTVPDQGCAGPVAYIIRGPLRRGLATFATSTGARETVGAKKIN